MIGEGMKILVAVDASKHSKYAVEYYLSHISHPGDHVILSHCLELSAIVQAYAYRAGALGSTLDGMDELQSEIDEKTENGKALLATFAQLIQNTGVKVETVILEQGDPGQRVIEAACEHDVKLIVVGSRGQSRLQETFLGSFSDYVIHHSEIPVLVCRHVHHF